MNFNPNGFAIPLFLILMLVEYLALRIQGKSLHRYNDSVNSLSMGLLLLTSDALLKTLTFSVFIVLYNEYRIFDFQLNDPLVWIVFFFGVDFCYYWFHRCAHEFNILWGAHVGHHQSEEYNYTTALRQSAFQYAFSWVFYLPLAILGCAPEVFLVQFSVLKIYQFWLHTQAIDKIPFIEGIFSTPSTHRVHHAKNPIYIDRNYGGTLMIWDRLFGSWQPELADERCHYGTTQPLDTLNPLKANLQHWAVLFSDSIKTKSIKDKFILWFKPTGWRPEDCREDKQILQHDGSLDREKYDPVTTRPAKIYAGLSMLSIITLSVMFIFNGPILTTVEVLAGLFSIILGLVMLNQFLEYKFKYWIVECIRWPVFIALFWQLATTALPSQVVQTIKIDRSAATIFQYVTIPNLWHEWHPQSLSVVPELTSSFQQGQTFNEVIQTAMGQDDLVWEVQVNNPNIQWIAKAYNPKKDVHIQLKYDLVSDGESTVFTRTLDYQMPNFIFHVLNMLYFNQYMIDQSWHSLESLKAYIEENM